MNLRCFFDHKWKIYKIQNYLDISFDLEMQSYKICFICKKCKAVKEEDGDPFGISLDETKKLLDHLYFNNCDEKPKKEQNE